MLSFTTSIVVKLQAAAAALEELESVSSVDAARRRLAEFVSLLRTVEHRLEGDTRAWLRRTGRRQQVGEFIEWWRPKVKLIEADPLLAWTRDTRNSEIHVDDGHEIALQSHAQLEYLDSRDLLPPPEGPNVVTEYYADGVYYVVDKGTARERKVKAQVRPESRTASANNRIAIFVENGPRTHLGESIETLSMTQMCELALTFWRGLSDEVRELWWEK